MLFYSIDLALFLSIASFAIAEWMGRNGLYALEKIKERVSASIRWGVYYLLIVPFYVYGIRDQQFT